MTTKKISGIALMLAFAGAFVAVSLIGPAKLPLPAVLQSLAAPLLALGGFLAWRILVWEKPRKKP